MFRKFILALSLSLVICASLSTGFAKDFHPSETSNSPEISDGAGPIKNW